MPTMKVVMHEKLEIVQKSQVMLTEWLAERGLTFSDEKTKIVSTMKDGFDFLGFEVKQYKNGTWKKAGHYKRTLEKEPPKSTKDFKVLIKPSKKAIKKHKEKIADVFGKMKAVKQDLLIGKLNPIIKGWANYYKGAVSSQVFAKLDHYIWQKAYRWAKRRHPKKNRHWVVDRYFKTYVRRGKENDKPRQRRWWFSSEKNRINLYSDTKIERHVAVRKDKSDSDGDTEYWGQRVSKGYDNLSPSKVKLLKKQQGKCPVCDGALKNTDLMETHHDQCYVQQGIYYRLALVHRHCHDSIHGNVRKP